MPAAATADFWLVNGRVILPDRVLEQGTVQVQSGRIAAIHSSDIVPPASAKAIDAEGLFVSPGFIDMHVHGGAGADFMDGTRRAFNTVLAAHLRHGTTTLCPTSTVARHDQILAFLELVREYARRGAEPARGIGRVAGAHLYGPYFAEGKIGCHPHLTRPPTPEEYFQYLAYADCMPLATCAPELSGSAGFYRAAHAAGVRLNAGHSNATYTEMEEAFSLGVRHVDHFFCAMSNYVSTRSRIGTPMQGGIMEYVLASDEMTTELIADGCHLASDLLRFALRMMGVERVALVSDSSRAMDMPAGEYLFGPTDGGERFYHDGAVGLTLDGNGLASSAKGLDFMVRQMHDHAKTDWATAVRMASLTPATIIGINQKLGSLEVGKQADIILFDAGVRIRRVFLDGIEADLKLPTE